MENSQGACELGPWERHFGAASVRQAMTHAAMSGYNASCEDSGNLNRWLLESWRRAFFPIYLVRVAQLEQQLRT